MCNKMKILNENLDEKEKKRATKAKRQCAIRFSTNSLTIFFHCSKSNEGYRIGRGWNHEITIQSFNAWCLLKGHTYLNKPAPLRCRFD